MRTALAFLLASIVVTSLGSPARAASPAQRCENGVASAVGRCLKQVNARVRRCYAETGAPCAPSDTKVAKAVGALEQRITSNCTEAGAQAAGFGALVTTAAVVDRAREACLGEPATLAARTFGGPQGALLQGAPADVRSCLDSAFAASAKFLAAAHRKQSACIRKSHRGGTCDLVGTNVGVGTLEVKAAAEVEKACPDLASLLRVSPAEYVARAAKQGRCLTATAHGDGGPLDLDCGPRASVAVPPRGQWVKVTLPEAEWGTRCGDGSPYAFWLRLAPEGSPVWQVVTDMQGGGVCIFASDCSGVSPGLFRADEGQPGGGYLSTNPTVNPFSDWTMLFMPYCTQDLHIGGGASSVFSPSFTVHRFGGVNVRAALRYLRDVLWAELEASDPDGWHPDRLRVMSAGESAGGFGVMYNYHDPLDELRWVNTTAVPDSGLALDSGAVGVLVSLVGGTTNPSWNLIPMLPPYCTANDCMVGPVIEAASVPRLEATPWQQILNVSNQVDSVQRSTTAFPSLVAWINEVRTTYCEERDQTGLHWFLPASNTSIHTMLRSDALYTGLTAQGVTVRDFVSNAMADPASVVDRVDEGTLVVDRPGVNPFACTLPPP
jgi:hypothetical protein